MQLSNSFIIDLLEKLGFNEIKEDEWSISAKKIINIEHCNKCWSDEVFIYIKYGGGFHVSYAAGLSWFGWANPEEYDNGALYDCTENEVINLLTEKFI